MKKKWWLLVVIAIIIIGAASSIIENNSKNDDVSENTSSNIKYNDSTNEISEKDISSDSKLKHLENTSWEAIPKKTWTDYTNIGPDITITSVSNDGNEISLTYGETLVYAELIDDTQWYDYEPINTSEIHNIRIVDAYTDEVRIVIYPEAPNYDPYMDVSTYTTWIDYTKK